MGLIHFLVKYMLFGVNLFFALIGIGLVAVGVYLHGILPDIYPDEDLEAIINLATIIVIVFGCITFLIAFSGCCGSVTENKCLLVTFTVFMIVLACLKVYVPAAMNKNMNTLQISTNDYLNHAFENSSDNVTFHMFEISFQCCGTTGPDSYQNISSVLPPSCCTDDPTISFESECLIEDAFSIGCLQMINDFFYSIGNKVKTIFIWIIVFEVLEVIAAIYLCISINKRRNKLYHQ